MVLAFLSLFFAMLSKFRQRFVLWLVFAFLGLSIAWCPNIYRMPTVSATAAPIDIANDIEDAAELEKQGKRHYSMAQFDRAIDLWQQAEKIYTRSQDSLSQGRVLSNLALAYNQLNDWDRATSSIAQSLKIIGEETNSPPEVKIPVLAQTLNNRGILELNQGYTEQAIASWEKAKVNYQLAADERGVIRTSINQASAFKELGLYRRAANTLAKVETSLIQQPDSLIKVTGLRSYGNILRLTGQVKRSQQVLENSLQVIANLDDQIEESKTLIELGNTYKNSDPQKALAIYHRALNTCDRYPSCKNRDLPLEINLTIVNLLLDNPQWQESKKLILSIATQLEPLPDNRVNIDRRVNFANALLKLHELQQGSRKTNRESITKLSAIDEFLHSTIERAKAIDYPKAQSYSWGLRGQIEEKLENWQQAQKHTQKALILGQKLNAPEIVYLWQWQSGRIDRALGEKSRAIAHYSRAVDLLKSLSQDLVAIDPEIQYSFREGVEPVYRELVSLLLNPDSTGTVSQVNLERGREVIESLQLAELNNFFREACLDAQITSIEDVDRQAAVIYPIILGDRLEVIVSLPQHPLQHHTVDIKQQDLDKIVTEFRQNIVIRSRRNFYDSGSKLYDLLIRPVSQYLIQNKITTLVFVPDGSLRNVPFGALYDGQRYLIENYNVALTPGLQLLSPRSIKQMNLKTIAAGLTESKQGFSPLNHVNAELDKIRSTVKGITLMDRDFTGEILKQKIQSSDYPIVHIATHGQFSSSLEDTFLLTWDDRLDIDRLDNILQTRSFDRTKTIELLVLSACETATGDSRAALGLAGIAVRAGARSTLATLWSVNDLATSKLMGDFYQKLSNRHLTKAEAVRQAQLSLLHSEKYRHPFYWASYVLLGNWL